MRYLRIFKALAEINFSRLVIYRAHLVSTLFSSSLWGVFSIVTTLIITNKADMFYSWNRADMLILIATFTIVRGVYGVLNSKGLADLIQLVQTGSLDSILLKPINAQFLISLRQINYSVLVRVLMGSIVLIYVVREYNIPMNTTTILGYILFIIAASILAYSIYFIGLTLLIWNPFLSNLNIFMNYFFGFSRYPNEAYTQFGSFFYYFLLPVTLVTVPGSKYFAGKLVFEEGMLFAAVTVGAFVTSIVFWNHAIKSYTSASS